MTAPLLFSEDQEAFAEMMAKLAEKEFGEGDLERATTDRFPIEQWRRLGDLGLLTLMAPTELGGQGADHVSMGIAVEHLARWDFNVSYLPFSTATAATLLSRHFDIGANEAFVEGVFSGELIGCGAITEPRSGSDAVGARVKAEPVEGGWLLSGEKTSVTMSGPADWAFVFATTDPSLGASGIVGLVVDLDDETVSRQVFRDPGFRPLGRGSITFDGTFVPRHRLLGSPGRGIQTILGEFDFTRPMLALMCVGAALGVIEKTVTYATEREVFGQPISRYQGVSFPLAEHVTVLEGIRWLAYRALALRDAGLPHTSEAAMVKWWAPAAAVQAINDCIVTHGHVGYSMEMPFMQLMNDVAGLQIGDGTPQIQKLIIARQMFGRTYSG